MSLLSRVCQQQMFLPDWSVNFVADARCALSVSSATWTTMTTTASSESFSCYRVQGYLTCIFLPSSCCTALHCAAPSFNIICGRQSCFYDTHCKWQALCCTVHCDFRNESERANGQHSLFCLYPSSLTTPLSYCISLRFPLVNVLRCRFGCCFCLHPIYVSPIKHMSNVAVVVTVDVACRRVVVVVAVVSACIIMASIHFRCVM